MAGEDSLARVGPVPFLGGGEKQIRYVSSLQDLFKHEGHQVHEVIRIKTKGFSFVAFVFCHENKAQRANHRDTEI
jgi:hypothetical protein